MDAQGAIVAVVGGIVAGLAVFSALLLLGVAIVRRLRLPLDLPDGPRFEPPPPPLRAPGEDARAVAGRQARLRARHARGLAALRAAQQCQELVVALPADRGVHADAAVAIERAAAAATEAAARAERRLAEGEGDDADRVVEEAAAAAERALADALAAAAALPDGQRRRALAWALLGAVAMAWLLAMAAIVAART